MGAKPRIKRPVLRRLSLSMHKGPCWRLILVAAGVYATGNDSTSPLQRRTRMGRSTSAITAHERGTAGHVAGSGAARVCHVRNFHRVPGASTQQGERDILHSIAVVLAHG